MGMGRNTSDSSSQTAPPIEAGLDGLGETLRECGEIASLRLSIALSEALVRAADQLVRGDTLAINPLEIEAMADAACFARNYRHEIARGFRRHFEIRYTRACGQKPSILSGYLIDFDAGQLSIIKHERLDDSLAPGMMTEAIRNTCWNTLNTLANAFSPLLQTDSVTAQDIPLAPKLIEATLSDAIREQPWRHDSKFWVMRALCDHFPIMVSLLYQDLIAYMQGALPTGGTCVPPAQPIAAVPIHDSPSMSPIEPISEVVANADLASSQHGNPALVVTSAQAGTDTNPLVVQMVEVPIPEEVSVAPQPGLVERLTNIQTSALRTSRRLGRAIRDLSDTILVSRVADDSRDLLEVPILSQAAESPATSSPVELSGPRANSSQIRLQDLKVGQWLDIREPEKPGITIKLAWISPRRNLYLMTNRQGERALSLKAESLEKLLSEGWARPVNAPDAPATGEYLDAPSSRKKTA